MYIYIYTHDVLKYFETAIKKKEEELKIHCLKGNEKIGKFY